MVKFEFSAGGIVLKKDGKKIEVLVAQHSQHHGWVFPKGLIGDHVKGEKKSASANRVSPKAFSAFVAEATSAKEAAVAQGFGETKEEAAVREVEEETGIKAKIIKALAPVEYWYVFGGEKIKKRVYYFLMKYVSGDITKHDIEMENVEWLSLDEVEDRLTYKSDKQVWQIAKMEILSLKN